MLPAALLWQRSQKNVILYYYPWLQIHYCCVTTTNRIAKQSIDIQMVDGTLLLYNKIIKMLLIIQTTQLNKFMPTGEAFQHQWK